MAAGQIHKSQPFYITWEIAQEAILKGNVVKPCTTTSGVKLTAGSTADWPPYGIALQAATAAEAAAAKTIPVCWLGIVECISVTAAATYTNQPLYSVTAGKVTTIWTTAIAESGLIGYNVDATTANALTCKIRLGAW